MHIHSHARALRTQKNLLVLLNTKVDCSRSRDKYILIVKKEKEKRNNIHLIEKTP